MNSWNEQPAALHSVSARVAAYRSAKGGVAQRLAVGSSAALAVAEILPLRYPTEVGRYGRVRMKRSVPVTKALHV